MKSYHIISTIGFIILGAIFAYLYHVNFSGKNAQNLKIKKEKTSQILENKEVQIEKAYFAGGCFWCTEADFEKIDGVIEVISGFSGGDIENPQYKNVASNKTKHIESIEVIYDANRVDFKYLTEYLFQHIDPTDNGGSFYDRGHQYTSAIFYQNQDELKISQEVIQNLEDKKVFPKKIVTPLLPFKSFWNAAEYHQDYSIKNPVRYKYYRNGSGRDKYIQSIWGKINHQNIFEEITQKMPNHWKNFTKPSSEELKKNLTEIQYAVTQKSSTERPFSNLYDSNKKEGIYVDIVSKEPLYSSTDKFDSQTGWPSFTKPLVEENIIEKTDYKLIFPRTEIRSKFANSHLGHLFKDGPKNKGGLRYCMNSAALEFIPKENLKKLGYEEFEYLFKK